MNASLRKYTILSLILGFIFDFLYFGAYSIFSSIEGGFRLNAYLSVIGEIISTIFFMAFAAKIPRKTSFLILFIINGTICFVYSYISTPSHCF